MPFSRSIISVFMLLFLAGCRRDIPEPESKFAMTNVNTAERIREVPVSVIPLNSSFYVRHKVNGENILVECIVPEISFRQDRHNKRVGKIVVFVDGKKIAEMNTPVFIIKGLTQGEHAITLEVVNLQNRSYSLKKEFNVTIL